MRDSDDDIPSVSGMETSTATRRQRFAKGFQWKRSCNVTFGLKKGDSTLWV